MADPRSPTPSQAGQARAAPQAQAQKPPVPTTLTLPPKPLKVGTPKRYDRSRGGLELFFSQLELYYRFNTAQFPTEQEKVLFTASYLDRLMFAWFNVYLQDFLDNKEDPSSMETTTRQIIGRFSTFKTQMKKTFRVIDEEQDTEQKLQALQQTGSASDFAAKFQQLSVRTQWGDSALTALFYQALKEQVKDDIAQGD